MWESNKRWTVSLDEELLWIMDWYFGQKWEFKVKMPYWWDYFLQTHNLLLDKTLTDWVLWIRQWCIVLLWCFHQLFGLSFWRHPFTVEDPLVSKWFNDKFVALDLFQWRSKLIYILNGLRVSTFSAKLNFWVNYSLCCKLYMVKWESCTTCNSLPKEMW